MDKGQYGNRQQVQSWFGDAPAEDAIDATIAGLRRISQLPTDVRERFGAQLAQEPAALRVLDDLKTTV